jgi:hypothetical protein
VVVGSTRAASTAEPRGRGAVARPAGPKAGAGCSNVYPRDPGETHPSLAVMATPTSPRSLTPIASPSVTAGAADSGVLAFVTRLNVALNRRRTYGGLHPMVVRTEEEAIAALDATLATRTSFTLGVTKQELLLNGTTMLGASGITRELAARLHRRGVGALTFHVGIDVERLQQLMHWLALEPKKEGEEGDDPADKTPNISGILVGRLAYDALMLGDVDKAADASIKLLWGQLAQIAADGTGRQYGFGTTRNADIAAAVGDEDTALDVMIKEEEHVSEIADSLRQLVAQPEFARRTAVALMNMAAQGAQAPPELRQKIGERLHSVLDRLGDSSFAPIIRGLGQLGAQQEFLLQVVDVLPVLAITNWLQVAARATEQELSHHLLRLMMKLSQHASRKRDGLTDASFRTAAKELVEGWVLSDPNPDDHVRLLDQIALVNKQAAAALTSGEMEDDDLAETDSARVVQMALEIDEVGADTIAAANKVVSCGGLPDLLGWLDEAGDTAASLTLRAHLTDKEAVRRVLLADPVDEPAARMLLKTVSLEMAETVLDTLAEAKDRTSRELMLERLRELGEPMRPVYIARLDGAPWFFARNLLGLLRDLIVQQDGTTDIGAMLRYLDHENPQVRVEATRMLLEIDAVRDAAIRRGLQDADERVVEVVLHWIDRWLHTPVEGKPHSISTGAAGHLMRFVDAAVHSGPLRVIAIRCAAATGTPVVRDWLLGRLIHRTTFLRRKILASPSLLNATALSALQKHFSRDPVVADALALGRAVKGDARWRVPTPHLGMQAIK